MKELYVSDLQPNQVIVSSFLVQSKDMRFKKSGEGYLSLSLSDKTGEVEAKIWENVDALDPGFERDDFVKVKAAVQVFRNKPQLTIYKLKKLEDEEVELADFFPHSQRDPEEMWQELLELVASLHRPSLRELFGLILDDPEIAVRLRRAPAAKTIHHAYLGGLLEHVLSVSRLARLVMQNYEELDEDLVFSGVILHDLGKIYEMSYARSVQYTTQGQLLGHMMLEMEILHEKLRQLPEFPRRLQVLLEHLIISHHGQYEFGSPKLPMFPEALLLHYVDDLDSKLQAMQGLLQRETANNAEWTGYLPSMGRPLLNVQKYLAGEEGAGMPASTEESEAEAGGEDREVSASVEPAGS